MNVSLLFHTLQCVEQRRSLFVMSSVYAARRFGCLGETTGCAGAHLAQYNLSRRDASLLLSRRCVAQVDTFFTPALRERPGAAAWPGTGSDSQRGRLRHLRKTHRPFLAPSFRQRVTFAFRMSKSLRSRRSACCRNVFSRWRGSGLNASLCV